MKGSREPKFRLHRVIQLASYLSLGIFGLGSIVGALNDANSFIHPYVTYALTPIFLLVLIFQEKVLSKYPVPWRLANGSTVYIKKLGIRPKLILVGMLILIWVPRLNEMSQELAKAKNSSSIEIPFVAVKVSNHTRNNLEISPRGDFILWLPGFDGRHMTGKYELSSEKTKLPLAEKFSVSTGSTAQFAAKILNPVLYSKLLEQEECDLSLAIRPVGGGIKFTENIPFTKEAIGKYYLTVDFDGG